MTDIELANTTFIRKLLLLELIETVSSGRYVEYNAPRQLSMTLTGSEVITVYDHEVEDYVPLKTGKAGLRQLWKCYAEDVRHE